MPLSTHPLADPIVFYPTGRYLLLQGKRSEERLLKNLALYAEYVSRELLRPINYLTALLIGLVVNWTTLGTPASSPIPFIIPLLVQIFSKGSMNFRGRIRTLLVQLPGEREDPAFVMAPDGGILAHAGHTSRLFREKGITSAAELFGAEDFQALIDGLGEGIRGVELSRQLYSPLLKSTYTVRAKYRGNEGVILVWMEDVSRLLKQEDDLAAIRRFSSQTVARIADSSRGVGSEGDISEIFFRLGYRGVLIARQAGEDLLSGRVYCRRRDRIDRSDPIAIDRSSSAPIWNAFARKGVNYAEVGMYPDREAFERENPFHPAVADFLCDNIQSYVNYQELDVAVIAFNKSEPIRPFDLMVMETAVNSALAITYLSDLARSNDERFLQSVNGLCAAAEYSDEITGRHILRVNRYAKITAEALGLGEEFARRISQVAALHDIGKVAVPHIVKLERRLSPDEFAQMQMHTVYGAQILEVMSRAGHDPDPRLEMAIRIALNHHQRWDGGGYPKIIDETGRQIDHGSRNPDDYLGLRGLRAEEIPPEALIVSLGDKYDALRSPRPYKPGKSHREALDLLSRDDRSGARGEEIFGEELFEAFHRLEPDYNQIYAEWKDA